MGFEGLSLLWKMLWDIESPPENCEKERFWFSKSQNSKNWRDNDATLMLLLSIYVSVLLVWIAFSFAMFIRDRQWSFVEHLLRENDGMEHHIIETEIVGKRARGRQRRRMFEWMTTRLNVSNAKS